MVGSLGYSLESLRLEDEHRAFNKNLISNPSGRDGFKCWQIKHGGDGMIVENAPIGSNPVPEKAGLPTQHSFVTSHGECQRMQEVNLHDLGVTPVFLKVYKPCITVSEWVCARVDCDSWAELTVILLKNKEEVYKRKVRWSSRDDGKVKGEWYKIEMKLTDYPDDITSIQYLSCGRDHQSWAGHYGTKSTGSSLQLEVQHRAFNKNLICNPSGREGFKFWQIKHAGDGMIVENTPIGSNPIPEKAGVPTQHCFVTSYGECQRMQEVSLKDLGVTPEVMNVHKPCITVSEMVCARVDCDSWAELTVMLLKNKEVVCKRKVRWSSRDDGKVKGEWYKMEMKLTDYPDDITSIQYLSCGQDHQGWAGHYGTKSTGSSLRLEDHRAFNKNLICNPSGRDGFKFWEIKHGGDGIIVENTPIGSNPIPEKAGLPTQHSFVTSYRECQRMQEVDLKDLGVTPDVMNLLKPCITVSEWVCARVDCDSWAELTVMLLKNKEVVCKRKVCWSSRDEGKVKGDWYKIEMKLTDYPEGITSIQYLSRGQDHQCWAGHYGTKSTGSSLQLNL